MLAGVCEGISRHLDIDPLLVRVIFGALTVFGGAGIVLYVIAWLTIPEEGATDSVASRAFHRDADRTMVLGLSLAAIAAAVTLLSAIGFATPRPWAVITVSLVALVLFALFSRRAGGHPSYPTTPPYPTPQSPTGPAQPAYDAADDGVGDDTAHDDTTATTTATAVIPTVTPEEREAEMKAWWQRPTQPGGPVLPPTPAPPPPPRKEPRPRSRLTPITLAVMVVTLGGIWLADATGADIHPSVYPGSVLALTAVALIVGTWFGRAKLLIPVGILAALLTAAFTVIGPGPYGERIYNPSTASAVESTYDHGAGRLVVNLSYVDDVDALDGRTIDVDGHVGLIQVVIPTTLDADVSAHVDAGDIRGPATAEDTGNGSEEAVMSARHDDRPIVTIDVDLRFGRIEILRFDCPGLAIAQRGTTDSQDLSTLSWEGSDRDPAACH
jgi:phage shock protein PspC (stress-responsive transcriptional regulator)